MSNENLVGTIKKNRHTEGHAAALRERGYEVDDSGDTIRVQVTRFVENTKDNPFDLTAPDAKEQIEAIVNEKAAFTYRTRFKVKGYDKPIFGPFAARLLGPASALMMVGPKAEKEKKELPKLDLGW